MMLPREHRQGNVTLAYDDTKGTLGTRDVTPANDDDEFKGSMCTENDDTF